MFTLPHGHPKGTRVAGGAEAVSEVESATTSDTAEVTPKKTTTKRRTAVKAEPETVTEDKTEE